MQFSYFPSFVYFREYSKLLILRPNLLFEGLSAAARILQIFKPRLKRNWSFYENFSYIQTTKLNGSKRIKKVADRWSKIEVESFTVSHWLQRYSSFYVLFSRWNDLTFLYFFDAESIKLELKWITIYLSNIEFKMRFLFIIKYINWRRVKNNGRYKLKERNYLVPSFINSIYRFNN